MLKAPLRENFALAVIAGPEAAAPSPRSMLVDPALAGLPGQVFLVGVLLAWMDLPLKPQAL